MGGRQLQMQESVKEVRFGLNTVLKRTRITGLGSLNKEHNDVNFISNSCKIF